MSATLIGDKKLDRKLKRLANKAAKKVSAAGTRAAMRVVVKGIKSEIPPHMKSARKAIGSRFKRSKSGEVMAKVGANVGKKKQPAGERAGRPGVGLGRGLHWLILGTAARTQKTTGRKTGIMPAIGVVKLGFAKTEAAAKSKMKETIKKGIEREARK